MVFSDSYNVPKIRTFSIRGFVMIIELFIDFFLSFILGLFGIMPGLNALNVAIPSEMSDTMLSIFSFSAYFIPIGGLLQIFLIFVTLDVGLLIWRFVMRIKSFIPTMGN
jgi:hypothetical protein